MDRHDNGFIGIHCEFFECVDNDVRSEGVEATGWFIKENYTWIGDEFAANVDALTLAAGNTFDELTTD